MFTLLYKWLISIFTVDKVGIIVRKLLLTAGTAVAIQIFDVDAQKKAYEFVKQLNADKTMTGLQKAKAFNKMFAKWLKKIGKTALSSTVNCLREMAVCAVKAEAESKETTKEENK